jgi:hypothetical protein
MTDDSQPHHTYRLLDAQHQPIDEAEWPNDAEAVAWAEQHRTATGGPSFRRIERRDGDTWSFVSEAGVDPEDRGSEDL